MANNTLWVICLSLIIIDCFCNLDLVRAQVACNTTLQCESRLQSGSICGSDGFCKNPYIGGCLRHELGEELVPRRRACNSHDTQDIIDKGLCEPSPFDYMEIRISPGNWESANFYAWLIQVILSELLFVPVSIDTGTAGELNFYDPNNGFAYNSESHNVQGLLNSNIYGDCRNTNKNCAHVIPEWWIGMHEDFESETEQVEKNINSMIGYVSWFVPSHVVEDDETLGTYHGYVNENEKLANTFKKPTTWGDYCKEFSATNCTKDDEFATGLPYNEEENDSYYFESDSRNFKGYFQATDRNKCANEPDCNCTNNPDCGGHFIDYPCEWAAYTDQQIYWNNIPLEPKSYSYNEIQQIFKAANATKSPIIHPWFHPDSLVEQYDLRKIALPEITRDCRNNRFLLTDRCTTDRTELRGTALGSCDYPVQILETVVAKSVKEDSLSASEELRSPAYETLRSIQINDLEVTDMLAKWVRRRTKETTGYHARQAACSWLKESFNATDRARSIKRFIPRTHPREKPSTIWRFEWYNVAAIAFGGVVILVVVLVSAATHYYRKAKVIKIAQREFLDLCSLGYLMVCIAAILCATQPTDVSCSAIQWLISIGYTQGMVPLFIKASAINRLMQRGLNTSQVERNTRQVKINKNHLYCAVVASTLFIGAYLLIWTFVDPILPTKKLSLSLQGDRNIVNVDLYCASSTPMWRWLAFMWEAVPMLASAILSFQSRKVRSAMNETRELTRMAYVHLVFFIVRILVFVGLPIDAAIPTSFLLSMDSLLSLVLYFGPKFVAARSQNESSVPNFNPFSTVRNLTSVMNRREPTTNAGDVNNFVSSNESAPPADSAQLSSRSNMTPPIQNKDSAHSSIAVVSTDFNDTEAIATLKDNHTETAVAEAVECTGVSDEAGNLKIQN